MGKREKEDVLKMRDFRKERKPEIKIHTKEVRKNLLINMRSEQILGNPKEKIFGVEILTAKEKPLKKNIFPKKRKSTTGKWKRNDL